MREREKQCGKRKENDVERGGNERKGGDEVAEILQQRP